MPSAISLALSFFMAPLGKNLYFMNISNRRTFLMPQENGWVGFFTVLGNEENATQFLILKIVR